VPQFGDRCDVQVDQADKLADRNVELRVRHRHTVRADTANEQVASPSMEVPSLLVHSNDLAENYRRLYSYHRCPSPQLATNSAKCDHSKSSHAEDWGFSSFAQ